jgi:hypothetical protein
MLVAALFHWLGLRAARANDTVLHVSCTVPFLLSAAFHDNEHARVVDARIKTTRSKNGGTQNTYYLTARTADGFELRDQLVPLEAFSEVSRKAGYDLQRNQVMVPIIRTLDSQALSFLGTRPYVQSLPIVVSLLLLPLGLLFAFLGCRQRLAWYDQKKLSEEGGQGPWQETRPARPVLEGAT